MWRPISEWYEYASWADLIFMWFVVVSLIMIVGSVIYSRLSGLCIHEYEYLEEGPDMTVKRCAKCNKTFIKRKRGLRA